MSAPRGFRCWYDNNNFLIFEFGDGAKTLEIKAPISTQQWYRIAAVFGQQEKKIFVNGKCESRFPNADVVAGNYCGAMMGHMGMNYLNGCIENFKVFCGELTDDEAVAITTGNHQVSDNQQQQALLSGSDTLQLQKGNE